MWILNTFNILRKCYIFIIPEAHLKEFVSQFVGPSVRQFASRSVGKSVGNAIAKT